MHIKDFVFVENEQKPFEQLMNNEMQKTLQHFEGEVLKIRTGRAHTSLVEDIMVEVYGEAPMPIKNVAAISAPDARLIVIQPWDPAIIPTIEKAISNSEVGIRPVADGQLLRLVLPEMSSSRREELTKILGKKAEEARVSIRNVRKDFNNLIRDAKKDKKISENFFNRLSDILQTITDNWIAKIDALAKKKETELKSF